MTSTLYEPKPTMRQEKGQMAYIMSASHSGSTLLAMLLGTQDKACTVGELRAPSMGDTETYRCSCGEKIRACPFWLEVSERMAARGVNHFDITDAQTSIFTVPEHYAQQLLEPLHRSPLMEAARDAALALSPRWNGYLGEVQKRNGNLVAVLKELCHADIIIDSSKSVLHLKYLLRNPTLEIKIIWLVRDGRAVTLSLLGHGLKRATRRETIAVAAREWRRSNEAAETLLNRLPKSQWIGIQYEDLCRQPEAVLRRACDFLGLESQSLKLDFRAGAQHILGNEMRLKTTSEIRLDERWRTQLSQDDLAVFESKAGEMNRKFGYE